MIKDEFQLVFEPKTKTISTIYQEGVEDFASDIGGHVRSIERVSHVEWAPPGWVVRSAPQPQKSIRHSPTRGVFVGEISDGDLVFFSTRKEALEQEEKFFHELMGAGYV